MKRLFTFVPLELSHCYRFQCVPDMQQSSRSLANLKACFVLLLVLVSGADVPEEGFHLDFPNAPIVLEVYTKTSLSARGIFHLSMNVSLHNVLRNTIQLNGFI